MIQNTNSNQEKYWKRDAYKMLKEQFPILNFNGYFRSLDSYVGLTLSRGFLKFKASSKLKEDILSP